MIELEKYIQSYFGIPKEDIAKIISYFKPSTLPKGDFFLKSGRICDKLSFIQSGLIRVYLHTQTKEITQWIGTKGYFITDLSGLIFQKPTRWNIQALTDCTLYTICDKDYHSLGKVLPRWDQLEKLFIAHCFLALEDRIMMHLSMTAEERYLLLFEQQRELFNQVPLQYLASMLGMTPETLSRLRGKSLK